MLPPTRTAFMCVWMLLMALPSAASPASAALRSQGDTQQYNLHLDEALRLYLQAVEADPTDPAAYRAVASAYMMKIAFHRGAVTADDFLGGQANADAIDVPKPPADLAAAFHRNAESALHLAERQVRVQPKDADAHYQLGAALGLMASYAATVEGQLFEAFQLARHAYKECNRALELDPTRTDAGLIIGIYEYAVSTRSMPVRWLARMGGLNSDKEHGIGLVEAVARSTSEKRVDAGIVLVLIYNREERYAEALDVLSTLQTHAPENRLLWLEAGSTALRARRFHDAARLLDAGFAQLSQRPAGLAFGEEALWHYKRGASLVGVGRAPEAKAALRSALRQCARDWVHGRAHAELGKLADIAGDRLTARQEYQMAVQLAKTADDSIGLAAAKGLLLAPVSTRTR